MMWLADLVARAVGGKEVAASTIVGVEVDVAPDVRILQSRVIPWLGGRLSGMRRSAAAVTLGRTVLVHPAVRADARLLRHELAHVAQWRREPLTFPFRYIRCHIRHGYRDNPYEAEARAAERPTANTGGEA